MNPCVETALKAGRITRDLAERLDSYDDINVAIAAETLGLTVLKREAAIQAVKNAENWGFIKSHDKGVYRGMLALLARDKFEKAKYNNVDKMQGYYESRYQAMWAEALEAFRTTHLGTRQDKEGLDKLVKAIYGEVVDDPEIMKFAKQWDEMTEAMRVDFNKKGGNISKNEKWRMPQKHDVARILNNKLDDKGLANWKSKLMPKLDRTQMLDDLGNELDNLQLDEALDYTFQTIVTRGLNKVNDFTAPRLGKKLSRKGSEKRFLYFKDAKSWMDYNEEFGGGDIFTTLVDHMQTRANDVALIHAMGPNPESAFQSLRAMADKEGALEGTRKSGIDALWNVVSGKINGGELVIASDVGQQARDIITATTLGAATISAISDVGFQIIASKTTGMPFHKIMSKMIKNLDPTNAKDQILAGQAGFGLQEWINLANSGNRFTDEFGTGRAAKVADFIIRASGLAKWTDAGRKATIAQYSAMLVNDFDKSFDGVTGPIKDAMVKYGITEDEWNAFRKTKPVGEGKAMFANLSEESGIRFHQMVMSEVDFFVPVPDANVRSVTTAGYERGSISGQGIRTVMNLKSFPITLLQTHGYRLMNQEGTMNKLQYTGLLLGVSTVMGGLTLQLKDIASGRNPRNTGYEDRDIGQMRKFFAAAMAQGGGAGILGDFAFDDANRFGGGPVESITGPTGELVKKSWGLTWGNVQQVLAGEETNLVPEAVQFIKRYTPDVFYSRLLTDAMYDQLTIMADPRYEKKFKRQMRKRERDYDQGYWWKKGETPEFMQ